MKRIVTGAAGFVGTNLTLELLKHDHNVLLIDDLSRPNVDQNRILIESKYDVELKIFDVTEKSALEKTFTDFGPPDVVVNLAGQVSLLASIQNPLRDFLVNAYAPLIMMEFFRKNQMNPIFINVSSNKIYGDLESFSPVEKEFRYSIKSKTSGFDESTPLDFSGPYGCSKGSSDQYLLDYARIFGMKTVSLRQSTIYGPHQQPTSDQGWVAHMVQNAYRNEQIFLNGVGKQVRDVLHVADFVELILKIGSLGQFHYGQAFNVGGGPRNSLSILELFNLLEENFNVKINYKTGLARPGDQKFYVSDITKISKEFSWNPEIDYKKGILEMYESQKVL